MATLAVSTVRSRVAAAIEAASGWTEAHQTWERFASNTRHDLHKGFTVAVTDTVPGPAQDRQKQATRATLVTSTVSVRWGYRVRADAAPSDTGSAYDAEAEMVQAVLGISRTDLHVIYAGSPVRDTSSGDWLIGESRFRVLHRIDLE